MKKPIEVVVDWARESQVAMTNSQAQLLEEAIGTFAEEVFAEGRECEKTMVWLNKEILPNIPRPEGDSPLNKFFDAVDTLNKGE